MFVFLTPPPPPLRCSAAPLAHLQKLQVRLGGAVHVAVFDLLELFRNLLRGDKAEGHERFDSVADLVRAKLELRK